MSGQLSKHTLRTILVFSTCFLAIMVAYFLYQEYRSQHLISEVRTLEDKPAPSRVFGSVDAIAM